MTRFRYAWFVLALAATARLALAQSSTPAKPWETATPPRATPSPPTPTALPGAPPTAPPQGTAPPRAGSAAAPGVIARVNGRPITERDYARIAEPYFARLNAQLGAGFTGDVRKIATHNVLDELIRRELLVIEGQKQNVPVTDADTDAILAQDPLFQTNGQFDPMKLQQFKLSPQSNYRDLLPQLRDLVIAAKMEQKVRASLTPTTEQVRAEWNNRNQQVRFDFLPITTRDVSLDPEADEAEQRAYYAAHPDQFERKARAALRYVRLPLPAEGDSARAPEEKRLGARAKDLADSLRKGVAIDSIPGVEVNETGVFEVPATNIPGIGRAPEIQDRLEKAVADSNLDVLGPATTPSGVVVATVATREAKRVPAFTEVRADVKRRADAEKRRTQLEADKRAYYDAHVADFRTQRAHVTRVLLDPMNAKVKTPSSRDVEKWYAANSAELFPADSVRPALTDSVRELAKVRMTDQARTQRTAQSAAKIAAGWRQNPRSVASLARSEGGRADTLTLLHETERDSIFPSPLVDSLLNVRVAQVGEVEGPRRYGRYDVLWRLDQLDTTYVPDFEGSRSRLERAFQEDRRKKDEDEAKVWFESHRAQYKTKPKFVLDVVRVPVPPIDSVKVTDAETRKFWQAHRNDRFKQEEEVQARHILIAVAAGASPAEDGRARARADSLRRALVDGADFADLARKFSADPGSGAQGGELGYFGRGRMVKEFQDTSFALQVGRVSQPTKTQFGYHLIRVDAKKLAGVQPYEDVRAAIHNEMARSRADSLGLRRARRLLQTLRAGGTAATNAAKTANMQTTPPVAPGDAIPGVGMVPDLNRELEGLKIATWAAKPYKETSSYVLVRPSKRVPAGPAEFEEVKRQAVEDMKTAQRQEIVDQRVTQVRGQLAAGAPLDTVAAPFGGVRDSGLLSKTSGFVPALGNEPRVVTKAFALKPGTVSDSIRVASGVVWVKPEEKKAIEGASFARDKEQITNELLAKNLEGWLERKKKGVTIEVLRADLREAKPPTTRTVTTTIGGQ